MARIENATSAEMVQDMLKLREDVYHSDVQAAEGSVMSLFRLTFY